MIQEIADLILNPEVEDFRGVKLPTPQKGGTDTQIQSYAKLQAKKFLIKLNLEYGTSYKV
jgi:hypothetical protein